MWPARTANDGNVVTVCMVLVPIDMALARHDSCSMLPGQIGQFPRTTAEFVPMLAVVNCRNLSTARRHNLPPRPARRKGCTMSNPLTLQQCAIAEEVFRIATRR